MKNMKCFKVILKCIFSSGHLGHKMQLAYSKTQKSFRNDFEIDFQSFYSVQSKRKLEPKKVRGIEKVKKERMRRGGQGDIEEIRKR